MVYVMKVSLGLANLNSLVDLELQTFDGLFIPFKLKISTVPGKPNSVIIMI